MDGKKIQGWLIGEKIRVFFQKNKRFVFMLLAMAFVYIYMGYEATYQQHRLSDAKKEMLDAKYEYLTISARWVNTTRQSQIVKVLGESDSNLRENTVPPVKIER